MTTPNVKSCNLRGADRFRIEREIADTLQGRIYAGIDLKTNREVVIKEAWKQLVHTKRSRKGHRVPENFLHERKMIMTLSLLSDSHNNIVRGIEQWDDEHCYYYAMEYCSGELFDYISKTHTSKSYQSFIDNESLKEQIPMKQPNKWIICVAKMFKQICEAVQWMHNKGYCHLDLSLENTMIKNLDSLKVKIIDFGLAQKFNSNDFRFQGRVGKLQYMCPEAYNNQIYDARAADVYTLGIMLFMMLIGAPPYQAPQTSNAAFNYFITGRIGDVLKHWKRLRLITGDALDLLTKLITYESNRININQILNHPFIKNIDKQNNQQHNNNDNNNQQIQIDDEHKSNDNEINTNTLSPVDKIDQAMSAMSIENPSNPNSPKQENVKYNNQYNQYNEYNQCRNNVQQKPRQPQPHHIYPQQPQQPIHPQTQQQPQFRHNQQPMYPDQQFANHQQQQPRQQQPRQQQPHQQQQHQYNPNHNHNHNHNNNKSDEYTICELWLGEWGLSHCTARFEATGWLSPADWHKLTVPVLKFEVGLNSNDANQFIRQYKLSTNSNNSTTNHYFSNDPKNNNNSH